MIHTCGICLLPLADFECQPCSRLARRYAKIDYQGAGADYTVYAYHEIAHCVLLLGRPPRSKDDTSVLEDIDLLSTGHSQVHEARTLALQITAFAELGWGPSLREAIGQTWDAVASLADGLFARGADKFHSPVYMENWIKEHLPRGDSRRVRTYIRTVREFRAP